MAEKVIMAYDARSENVRTVSVAVDPDKKPLLTMDGREPDENEAVTLGEWDRTLLKMLETDLWEYPMFDGERIFSSRAHFTLSLPAREAAGDDPGRGETGPDA